MVERYTPDVASQISGVPAEKIVQAARLYGRAKTGMVMHARGIEHHTNGVNNVLSYINLVLATGKIGAPGRGYGTITGQGNGQGGREHGQKADQLPGPAFDHQSRTSQVRLRRLGLARRRTAASRRFGRRDVSEDARRRDQGSAFDLQQRDGLSARHE